MSGEPILSLRGIAKAFHDRDRDTLALEGLNLEVAAGEFVCLLGTSGCGKSTLLNLIAGLERPTAGEARFNGKPIPGPGPDRVMMFQDAALFPWLTAQGNVEFGLRQAGMPAAQREKLAREWLARVHLSGFERAAIHQLSGGMRQRVALARSLAIDPAVLLMDEPFAALDALTRERLHRELESLWAATGKTIVFVTHNVREAVALGDRVLVFAPRPGRLVAEFPIRLPRPRSLLDPALIAQTARIMDALRAALAGREEEELA